MPNDRDYDDQYDEPTKRLDEDYETPFSPPSDSKQRLPKDHPSKDDAMDETEEYNEGSDDAALDNPPGGDRGVGPRPNRIA